MIPDPLSLLVLAACFAAVTLLTIRRPAYGACALTAAVPFALYQETGPTTVTLLKVTLAGAALGLFVRPGIFAALGERAARPFLLGGMAVVAATALSYAQAHYHAPVVRETFKAIEYLAVFAVTFCAYRADPDRVLLRGTIVVVAVCVCFFALTQELYGATSVLLMNGHPTPRIAGPLEGPNQLAGYFDITLPLLVVLGARDRGAIVFAVFLCAAADVLTFSRGGAIGALAALITLWFVARPALLARARGLAAGGVAGGIVASVWGALAHTFGLSRFWDLSPSAYGGGVGTRPLLWRAALQLWREHPLLGIGAGNFEREVPQNGLTHIHTHANSLYLQALVEGGMPLLAATVYLLAVSIVSLARRAVRAPLAAAALAATIALAAHQSVDLLVFYPKVGAWWWMTLAFGAADE